MLHSYGTKETKKAMKQGCHLTKSHKINPKIRTDLGLAQNLLHRRWLSRNAFWDTWPPQHLKYRQKKGKGGAQRLPVSQTVLARDVELGCDRHRLTMT